MTFTTPNRGNQLLSMGDTAAFLQVSQKTVRRKIASGELHACKVGAQWRIRPEDIEAFLARNGSRLSIAVR